MQILLVPVGSAGDVYPYVGVGVALKSRGNNVAVVTNPHFASLIQHAGLRFIPVGTTKQFDAITQHPDLWHQDRGLSVVAAGLRLAVLDLYRVLADACAAGQTLLVGSGLAFAARVAHDTLGIPLVTIHLQPSSLVSAYDMPVLHPWLRNVDRLPRPLKRLLLTLLDRAADHALAPAANALTGALKKPPVRRIMTRWWHSPQRVIGLFPEWFAPPQPDWPEQTVLTGFPLYDEAASVETDRKVDRFLDTGSPPVIFVPGSANRHASRFFAAAAEASHLRGSRAIFLTHYVEQVPKDLPEGVCHFDYAPLGRLLPRAAALVHHGGIGTAAQGLSAGRPQLVMPMAFDQHDNAQRLERLGVGCTLRPNKLKGKLVARLLDQLLESSAVNSRCIDLAGRLRTKRSITQTCDLIEAAAESGS